MALSPEQEALAQEIAKLRAASRMLARQGLEEQQRAVVHQLTELMPKASIGVMTRVNELDQFAPSAPVSKQDVDSQSEPESQEAPKQDKADAPEQTPQETIKSVDSLQQMPEEVDESPIEESAQPQPEPTPTPEPEPAPDPTPDSEQSYIDKLANTLNSPDFNPENFDENKTRVCVNLNKSGLEQLSTRVPPARMEWLLSGVAKEVYPPTSIYQSVNGINDEKQFTINSDFAAFVEGMRAEAIGKQYEVQKNLAGSLSGSFSRSNPSFDKAIDTFGRQFDALAMVDLPGITNVDSEAVRGNIDNAVDVQEDVIKKIPAGDFKLGLLRKMAPYSEKSALEISSYLSPKIKDAAKRGDVAKAKEMLPECIAGLSRIGPNEPQNLQERAAAELKNICELGHDARVPDSIRSAIADQIEDRWPQEADLMRYRIATMVTGDQYQMVYEKETDKASNKAIDEISEGVSKRRKELKKQFKKKYGKDKAFFKRVGAIDVESTESVKVFGKDASVYEHDTDKSNLYALTQRKGLINYLGFKGSQKHLVNSPKVSQHFRELIKMDVAQPNIDQDID